MAVSVQDFCQQNASADTVQKDVPQADWMCSQADWTASQADWILSQADSMFAQAEWTYANIKH